VKSGTRPDPCTNIEREQNAVHGNDPAPQIVGSIVE
jgi:hypothetical protein